MRGSSVPCHALTGRRIASKPSLNFGAANASAANGDRRGADGACTAPRRTVAARRARVAVRPARARAPTASPRAGQARPMSATSMRAAQRAGAHRLLALDRRGDALPRRAPLELARRPQHDRDVRGEHEQPDEERHRARQRHPARAAERRGAEPRGGDRWRRRRARARRSDVQAAQARAFAID